MTIKDIKKGDLFTFKIDGRIYIRGHYDRSSKTYAYFPYDDVNDEHFARPTRKVFEA